MRQEEESPCQSGLVPRTRGVGQVGSRGELRARVGSTQSHLRSGQGLASPCKSPGGCVQVAVLESGAGAMQWSPAWLPHGAPDKRGAAPACVPLVGTLLNLPREFEDQEPQMCAHCLPDSLTRCSPASQASGQTCPQGPVETQLGEAPPCFLGL